MPRRRLPATAKQGDEQCLIELMWLLLIDFTQNPDENSRFSSSRGDKNGILGLDIVCGFL
jgi:hypothetical protein